MSTYPIIRRGSRSTYVADVQAELNNRVTPYPGLVTDGIFGGLTMAAVKRFQAQNVPLTVDGIVGPKTHGVLFAPADPQPIFHNVRFISQPTPTQCWAASTAMMIGSTVQSVVRATPSDMIASDGGLLNYGEGHNGVIQGDRYGRVHGLSCHAPMSWTAELMRETLERSPLMFDMLWNTQDYVDGNGSPGHMVVIAGCRGHGRNLDLSVYDPWPPRRGRRSIVNYDTWMRSVPTRTYRVFEWRGY